MENTDLRGMSRLIVIMNPSLVYINTPPPLLILKQNLLTFFPNSVLRNVGLVNVIVEGFISLALSVADGCLESFVRVECSFLV